MDQLIAKAEVLLEALPYIQRFRGKTIVIKYGGHAMTEEALKSGFAEDLVLLKSLGLNPVVVHGGGPQIGKLLDRMGIKSRFVRGMRVTDFETMELVEMVLVGQVNRGIVATVHAHGGKALGLSGKDGHLIVARRLSPQVTAGGEKGIDMGMVGEVDRIQPEILDRLVGSDFIPVIAPIGLDDEGETYNINADVVASEVARALGAEKLILLTDVSGIRDSQGKVRSFLGAAEAQQWIQDGTIRDGMIPKVECGLRALEGGVRQTHVIDGRVSHAVLLEIFTKRGVGTELLLGEATSAQTERSKSGASQSGPRAAVGKGT